MSKHGNVVAKTQCPRCAKNGNDNSRDNLAVYDSGYAKCFAGDCEYFTYDGYDPSIIVEKKPLAPVVNQGLIYTPIKSRGISKATCEFFGYAMYKDSYGNPMHVMRYGKDSQKFRTRDKNFFWKGDRQGMLSFFGQEKYNRGKVLVITEGEIDAMSIAEVRGTKWPVVSLPNGSDSVDMVFKHNIEWLKRFDEIILFFDNDEAGSQGVDRANEILPGRIRVASYPDGCKDANDMLIKGLNKEMESAFWNAAKPKPNNNGIVNIGDIDYEDFATSLPDGVPYEFPGLTKALGGLRKARLDLWAAGSGCGKSSMLKQIAHYNMHNDNSKWGLIFMEEQDMTTVQSFIAYELGIKLSDMRENIRAHVSPEDFQAAKERMNRKIEVMEHAAELSYDELVNKIEYMVKNLGCDFVILDHISIAVAGAEIDDERKAIDVLMKHLYTLIDRTGVGIQAIVHLKNLEGGKDWTEGVIPRKSHLRGSGGLAQMSYNIITLSRDITAEDPEDRLATYIHIQKCREKGESTGVCTDKLIYDVQTGRLNHAQSFPICPHGKRKMLGGF